MPSYREEDSQDIAANPIDNWGPIIKRFFKLLKRFYLIVVIYIIIVMSAAWFWLQMQIPLYEATATILVDPTLVSNEAEKQSLENLALQATLISSPGILNRVVERYNLNSIYAFNKSGNPMAMLESQMSVRPNLKSKTIDISFLFISRSRHHPGTGGFQGSRLWR